MEVQHKCPVCEMVCNNKSNLLIHIDAHEGYGISCINCKKTFKNKFCFDFHRTEEVCKKSKPPVRQLHQCPECPQSFPNRRHFNKHIEGHKRNNCQYCDARHTTRKELILHMTQEHNLKLQKAKYQCQFCERCFVKQVTLFNHYNHHANGKYVCQGCGLFLETKEEFQTHREKHEQERPWKCTRCVTTFSRRQQYLVHMESHEKYQCENCNTGFAAKATLQEHIRICQNQSGKDGQLECPECGKIFSGQGQLKLHLKAHTGEEGYTCIACKKSFETSHCYNEHVQSAACCKVESEDNSPRPYECKNCPRRYQNEYLLVEHMNRMHGAALSYKCTFCDYTSGSRANMTRHLALHTERRRFVCDQCGAAFHAHTTLKDHCTSVHSQQRHFSCSTCTKTFKLQSDLRRHIRSHSDTRPFKCERCNQAYKRTSHLRRHEEKMHGAVFGLQPRRLQRIVHDESGALVPIVEETKKTNIGVKQEPPVSCASKQWSSSTDSKTSVFTNPVLSLVDANSGKVLTLQELHTVTDAQILTADLSTAEVLTLSPDDQLATIVSCANGSTLDTFQPGEVMQTIQVTYDLSFPTTQALTTVLSTSEPRLVFATPITMSLDQTVLAVSQVRPTSNLEETVQLLEMQDPLKLPETIFIEQAKLQSLEEPMLLDSTEAVPLTLDNFAALNDNPLHTQVTATTSSAIAVPNLPESVESVLQLHHEQLTISTNCTVPSSSVLTSGSLLRERLLSGPKMSPSVLVQTKCSKEDGSAISLSCPESDSAISTLSISSGANTSVGNSGTVISIPNSVQSNYPSINVDSVITSFQSSFPDVSVDSAKNVIPLCSEILVEDSNTTDIPTISIPDTADAEASDSLCLSDISDENNTKTTYSVLSSVHMSHSDIEVGNPSTSNVQTSCNDIISTNPSTTTVSPLSVDALDDISDSNIHRTCNVSIQAKNKITRTNLVLTSLPESSHSHSDQSEESTMHSEIIVPELLPRNFPFLNVE